MRKLSAKWVPKCLNADQKRQRCQSSEQLLEFFRRDPNDFLSRMVTMDETCLYHYDSDTKQQSMEWRHSGSPRPQKIPSAKLRWKSSRLEFLGSRRHPHYLPKGQTISAEYYSFLLVQLKGIFKEKRRGKVTSGVFFLHDNSPANRTIATQKKLAYMGFHYLDHPPYSAYLAASDYHLFPGLKKTIESSSFFFRSGGHCCRGGLVGGTTFWIFLSGLQKLEQRIKKCIELRGEYVE